MKIFENPILILVIIIVIFGLAYGPIKNAALNKNISPVSVNNNSSISSSNSFNSLSNTTGNDEGVTVAGRSPYYGKISISNYSSIYNTYNTDPDNQYFSLVVNLNKNENLNITGWHIKSEMTGNSVAIPGAELLPFPQTRTATNIILKQGDRVYVNKGFSPVGISFRTNKCTGYFTENRTFVPGIPMQCPSAKDENLPRFSSDYDLNNDCLNTIAEIPQCTTVSNTFIRDLPDNVVQSCKDYMTTQINYNECVTSHENDADFAGNEYHIYLNMLGPLWRTRSDKIDLYDQDGLMVDTISY